MARFVLGFDPRGGRVPDAAERFDPLPFYRDAVESWSAPDGRCALWWQLEEDDGAARVAAGSATFAAWFGRPIAWTGDEAAGQVTLDAAYFDRPAAEWAPGLDGRCAVLRYDGEALEVYTDPLGSYPLYRADGHGVTWIANSPALLEAIGGDDAHVAAALAGIVGGGWSLSGDPPVAGVRRIAPETAWRFGAADAEPTVRLLDLDAVRAQVGRPLDTAAAATMLGSALAAQADWPGRPSVVPLTGGRDSRLVLAAALGRFDFTLRTGGAEADPDVRIARELAALEGLPHALMDAMPDGDRLSDPVRAARVLWSLTGGTASLANGAGFPLAPWGSPRPLWHSGQGGETARRIIPPLPAGRSRALDALARTFLALRPGRPALLNDDGVALVRDDLTAFLDEMDAAGFRPEDVSDLYYVRQRMGVWAGPTHAAVEPIRDVTSILWSRRALPFLLAGTVADRRRERLHREVVGALAPRLVAVPFQDGSGWTGSARLQRARTLSGKVRRELRRRVRQRQAAAPAPAAGPAGPPPRDPHADLIALTRAAVAADSAHPAWTILDRPRVETLLALPPSALDEWRWYQVWRLATLFLPRDAS